MGLIATIVVGLIAGLLASRVMKAETSAMIDILLGVAGSILGGWITSLLLGVDLVSGFNLTSVLVAFGGAVLVIVIYRAIKK